MLIYLLAELFDSSFVFEWTEHTALVEFVDFREECFPIGPFGIGDREKLVLDFPVQDLPVISESVEWPRRVAVSHCDILFCRYQHNLGIGRSDSNNNLCF